MHYGVPVTNPTVYGSADRPVSFLGTVSFLGDSFVESLGEAGGRFCARESWTCPPSQAAATSAMNKPARIAPQTLIVQAARSDSAGRDVVGEMAACRVRSKTEG